ncbi:testis-expressed protein 13D [Phacochoerus africanus]|uniref:testis-expressed protein 13D n=1 Tax=Phacochoerus africanus TaxID=41426 RepID=UPI001FDA3E11|nr:testis-expressed protein 13D [Phacochoerus africanus]
MAVDFGDQASGFRHNEVIRFINNEVLMNGGGPDFYVAFRSKPWSEVEDRLRVIVADPQVPHSIKRACAWSALALSVRLGARQQEQQVSQIRRLQEQLEEREVASWALASELQRLRDEREEVVTQLGFTQAALQQALNEYDMLRGQLLQVERLAQVAPQAQDMAPCPRAEQLGAAAWPLNAEQQRDEVAMGVHGRLYFEAQMPASAAVFYGPGPLSPWAQAMQHPLLMPMPYPFPFHAPFPMGFPFLAPMPPPAVMEAEAADVPPQMPPPAIYPPGPGAAVSFQEETATLGNQQSCSQGEDSATLQGTDPLGDISGLSQKECLARPQGMVPLGGSWNLSQDGGLDGSQGMVPLGGSWNRSQDGGPERPQGMVLLGASGSSGQEEVPQRPQGTVPLGGSRSQSQEGDLGRPQGTVPLGDSRSHKQEDPERSQRTVPLEVSRSQSQEESPHRLQGTRGSRGQSQERGLHRSQGLPPSGGSRSQSQEGGPQRPQGMEGSRGQSQEGSPQRPQGMEGSRGQSQEGSPQRPQGMEGSRGQSQEGSPQRPQGMEGSRGQSQEGGPWRPQGMPPMGFNRRQGHEGGPERPQATAQVDSWSHVGRENPKKQQPQGQKTKQLKGKRASESYHQEQSASGCSSVYWDCPWCKAVNFPWRKACYKCKRVCMAVESGGPDPGQSD